MMIRDGFQCQEELHDGLMRRYRIQARIPELFDSFSARTAAEILMSIERAQNIPDEIESIQQAMRWHTEQLLNSQKEKLATFLEISLQRDSPPDWLHFTVLLEVIPKINICNLSEISVKFRGRRRADVKRELFDRLENLQAFPLPESLVQEELTSIVEEMKIQDSFEAYRALAERRVKIGLILIEIAEQNAIEVPLGMLQKAVIKQVNEASNPEAARQAFRDDPKCLEALRRELLEELTVNFILSKHLPSSKQI